MLFKIHHKAFSTFPFLFEKFLDETATKKKRRKKKFFFFPFPLSIVLAKKNTKLEKLYFPPLSYQILIIKKLRKQKFELVKLSLIYCTSTFVAFALLCLKT